MLMLVRTTEERESLTSPAPNKELPVYVDLLVGGGGKCHNINNRKSNCVYSEFSYFEEKFLKPFFLFWRKSQKKKKWRKNPLREVAHISSVFHPPPL